MKKLIFNWIILVTLLAGCDNTEFNPDYYMPSLYSQYLKVSKDKFMLNTAENAYEDFVVDAESTPWAFSNNISWVKLSPMSGIGDAYIRMNINSNPSADVPRTGVFHLNSRQTGWDYSIPIDIQQPAAVPYALFSNNASTGSTKFSGIAQTKNYEITSNCTWSVQCSVSWLTVKKISNKELQITSLVNSYGYERKGTVKLMFNGASIATLTVVQQSPDVSISTETINLPPAPADCKLTITSQADWTVSTTSTWLQFSNSSGKAGTSEITIHVSPNTSTSSRTGYVYVKVGTEQLASLTISQKGLSLTADSYSFTLSSGTVGDTLNVTSNTSWKIKSVPDWLSVSPMQGSGDALVKLVPKDNPNLSSRSATIVLYVEGVSLSKSITVTQKGKSFSYDTGKLACSDDGQTLKLNIKSDGYWTASTTDTWITLNPGAHQGNGELAITVTENMAEDSRTGNINLSIGDKIYNVSVTQAGKFFKIDATSNSIGSTGGKLLLDITTNSDWTASVENSPSWLTVSPVSGKDSASIEAVFQDNPSVNSRTATIVVLANNGKSLKVTVSQAARYLTVNHQSVVFFAKGGTVDNIEIKTDGKYEVTSQGDWFTYKVNADNTISVTASENTTTSLREGVINIKLTDLKEGELSLALPVAQAAQGGSFVKNPYSQDISWDLGGNQSVTFKVNEYSTDKNWDAVLTNKQVTVTKKGYDPDKNWDN